jgi:hypothetical protein
MTPFMLTAEFVESLIKAIAEFGERGALQSTSSAAVSTLRNSLKL